MQTEIEMQQLRRRGLPRDRRERRIDEPDGLELRLARHPEQQRELLARVRRRHREQRRAIPVRRDAAQRHELRVGYLRQRPRRGQRTRKRCIGKILPVAVLGEHRLQPCAPGGRRARHWLRAVEHRDAGLLGQQRAVGRKRDAGIVDFDGQGHGVSAPACGGSGAGRDRSRCRARAAPARAAAGAAGTSARC